MACIHYYGVVHCIFIALEILCAPLLIPFLQPQPLATTDLSCFYSFAFSRMSHSQIVPSEAFSVKHVNRHSLQYREVS